MTGIWAISGGSAPADAPSAVRDIIEAERTGIQSAWATMGGAGGVDLILTWAAALVQTERIRLGTAIAHTWARHPLVFANEAAALGKGGRL